MPSLVYKRTALAVAIAGAFGLGALAADRQVATPEARAAAPVATSPVSAQRAAFPNFADLVARESPAVVEVSTARGLAKVADRDGHEGRLPRGIPPELAPFFRGFPDMPDGERRSPSQGMGSGFIIDSSGIVLTNAHVVDGAEEVIVRTIDRREFRAKVLGTDKPSDVAVLKIDASNLPTVRLGDASKTRVGEWVVAI